jgi:hypothetical protein
VWYFGTVPTAWYFGTVPKPMKKIIERGKIDTLRQHRHDHSHFYP